MMKYEKSHKKCILTFLLTILLASCTKRELIRNYPISGLNEVIDNDLFKADLKVTNDGNGSLSATVDKAQTIKIFEIKDAVIPNRIISYKAFIKTKDFKGKVYLEMLCDFEGQGQYFARSLNQTLSGTQNWTELETRFFLKKGEKPNAIKLNLVAAGAGEVWIDQISLASQKNYTLVQGIIGALIGLIGAFIGIRSGNRAKQTKK